MKSIFDRAGKLPKSFNGTLHYLVFQEKNILYNKENKEPLFFDSGKSFQVKREFLLCIDGDRAYLGLLIDSEQEISSSVGTFSSLREIYREVQISEHDFRVAVIGQGYINWERTSRFCGHCGGKTESHNHEHAVKCLDCGMLFFPRISPAVIIAIQKGDSVLLAHNHNFREGLYGLIAGFIETGETAEEAVIREIREEVGIEVENVTYHMSQSWPFPDSLMFGFSAEWKKGEVTPDGTEILDAQWFNKDTLPPELPGPKTIAGALFRKITGYKG